jgi:hypothetical protein
VSDPSTRVIGDATATPVKSTHLGQNSAANEDMEIVRPELRD